MVRVAIYDAHCNDWLSGSDPHEIVVATSIEEVDSALRYVEATVEQRGMVAVGFISYEAAPAFDAALRTRMPDPSFPLLWFALFENVQPGRHDSPAGALQPLRWQPDISYEEYRAAIARIRHHIAEGDTYQVNYSFRMRSPFAGDPLSVFNLLIAAQPSRHAAFIETDEFAVCSASPELFFSLQNRTVTARPMKGTMPRGLSVSDDERNAEMLLASEKNRAENVMIVDMMRNDLGRIARAGSVRVPTLFTVERYPTVWQLTSTVTAETDASVSEIVAALFPCASVTGAPKARTMQIIAELETAPRKIYTGAIGFIAPGRRAQFNVAIRTVLVDTTGGNAEYGVGGGIVWDSTPENEYDECLAKARLLTERRPAFELIETMLFSPREGFFLLDAHLERLKASARFFDYPLDERLVRRMLHQLEHDLNAFAHDSRVRLVLHRDGSPSFAIRPLERSDQAAPVRVRFAAAPIDARNVFLYHKTTNRALYEEALNAAGECEDVILWNEREEITESTIANIVVELDGALYTPPVSCGLLAGTFREHLLRRGEIRERIITKNELPRATQLYLINSVRGWQKAILVA